MDPLKMYFHLKNMGTFQPAILVYQRVTLQKKGDFFNDHVLEGDFFQKMWAQYDSIISQRFDFLVPVSKCHEPPKP